MPSPAGAAERAAERAAKNTVVRLVGEVVGKLASFVLFAALARAAGEAGLGIFVFAFAFAQIATTPVGLGFDRYMLRQVAKDRRTIEELFYNVLALKLSLAVPILAIAFVVVNVLDYDATTRAAVYVLSAGVLLDLLAKSVFYVFNAFERGELLAITVVVQRVGTAALGLAALAAGFGVVTVAAVYTLGAAVGLALALVLLARRVGLPRLSVSRSRWRGLTRRSLPYATQDIFGVLLAKVDVVLLSFLATEAVVGRYGAAYRLLEATFFVTSALTGAFSAMYTYLDDRSTPSIQSVFSRSLKLSVASLVPFAVTFGVLAEPISRLIFGDEFADSAGPLRLLAGVVVLYGLLTLSSSLIVSRRDPRIVVVVVAGMALTNLGLNLVLIPPLGAEGAAAAMLITDAIFVVVMMAIATRTVGSAHLGRALGSPLVAGAAMGAVMATLSSLPVVAAAGGVVVYIAVLLLLERTFNPLDLEFVRSMVRRRLPSRATG
jgi:O-antigen/teichoic acid export membrane protein